jgi:hypothetical protein
MTWKVTLHQKVTEVLWLSVEAPTEDEAKEKALKEAVSWETWPHRKFEDDAVVVACNQTGVTP